MSVIETLLKAKTLSSTMRELSSLVTRETEFGAVGYDESREERFKLGESGLSVLGMILVRRATGLTILAEVPSFG